MMKHADISVGEKYKNIKNGKIYTVIAVGLHSETYDMEVAYMNDRGCVWFRPIGLFCLKFEKVVTS